MKNPKRYSAVLSVLLILSTLATLSGCDKSETAKIMKELPKMYLNGNLSAGEYAIIQTQAELLGIFPQEEIEQSTDLQEIDFSTQTLLIGRDNYNYAAVFNYEFYSIGEDLYLFKINISGGYTVMDYGFLYGVVISKLPANAEVVFNINKQNNQ